MSKPLMVLMMVMLLISTLGWGQQHITFNVAHINAIASFAVKCRRVVVQHTTPLAGLRVALS